MITGKLEHDMDEAWGKNDSSIGHRSAWPVWAGNGATNTSTVYFEIDAGKHIGAHVHDADETIVLLEGSGRGRVGHEETDVSPGMVVHAPEGVTHDFHNTSTVTMKLVGFFSKPKVVSVYEDELMPEGTNRSGTPS